MIKKDNTSPLFSSKGNGKLLLSGEYLVLKGAKALSISLRLGQSMDIFSSDSKELTWEAYHPEGLWNNVKFNDKLTITDASNNNFAKQLQKILRSALKLSTIDIADLMNKKVVTKLDFMPSWGLGSSSTLIYNISNYFKIDPHSLLKETFKGSGYDIASAGSQLPIFFLLVNRKPRYVEIHFSPSFSDKIFFIYSGLKKNSKSEVNAFNKKKIAPELISDISTVSTLMTVCTTASEFRKLMDEHENIIGKTIGKTPIKQELFSDFKGSIKSLGAWGGDFLMAVSEESEGYVETYFKHKNLPVIFNYNDLILYNPCH